jgi:RNA polymerase sigma-70 factor (ECF subfamily)
MNDADIDDPVFVARLRERDPGAMETVVSLYLPQAVRAARASGLLAQEADDVVQSAFATFIEKISEFEGRSKVRTWLFGILYRKILEFGRQIQRLRQLDDSSDLDNSRFHPDGTWARPPQAADMALYQREIGNHIQDCIEGVPHKYRMAFVFREVELMETGDICQILDVTPSNFGVLIHRARNQLRDCLEAKGIGKYQC